MWGGRWGSRQKPLVHACKAIVVLNLAWWCLRRELTTGECEEEGTTRKSKLVVGVTSQKSIKVQPVHNSLHKLYPDVDIELITFKSDSGIANNPVGEVWGIEGAQRRIENAKRTLPATANIHYWVSIENYVRPGDAAAQDWLDIAAVVIKDEQTGVTNVTLSNPVSFPAYFAKQASDKTSPSYKYKDSGFEITVGTIMKEYFRDKFNIDIEDDDWHVLFSDLSRTEIIEHCVYEACSKYIKPLAK
jgi:non-canonical (house-cleaning) NTP pyrophosphatase